MSILDDAVAIANAVTQGLDMQGTVTYERWLSADDLGAPSFAAAVTMRAVIDQTQRVVKTSQGELATCRSSVLFIDLPALLTATEGVGMTEQDRITLPDGTTGPILSFSGFMDAGNRRIYTQANLG